MYRRFTPSTRIPIAKVRPQVADFDQWVEAAVDEDMVDDMLLGLNIGKATLAKWLLDPSLAVPIRLTRAQSAAEDE